MNANIIETLELLKETHIRLSAAWDYYGLSELDSNKFYPYDQSFDELTFDVVQWVNAIKKELLERK